MEQLIHARNAARAVRRWAEKAYSHTRYSKTLNGYCSVCSYRVWKRLKAKGIDARFVINYYESHAYVLVGEYVVDVTATQFGKFPKVMVRLLERLDLNWKPGRWAITEEDIRKLLKKWPTEQVFG